jgi:hypothetical protein
MYCNWYQDKRVFSNKLNIAYTLLVIAAASVQINLFANGYDFVSGFLHIDFDPYNYDSVYWGALFFYCLSVRHPTKQVFSLCHWLL